MEKICGIYKITSPSGKVYIGQSIDIDRRFGEYKRLVQKIKKQPRLYQSFMKHGVENHIFEVIEHCDFIKLNIQERYWQDFYNVIGNKGLNCNLVSNENLNQKISEETRKKMSLSGKNKIITEQHKLNIKNNHYSLKPDFISPVKDKKLSKEHLSKIIDKLKIPVLQYNLEGIFINEFESAAEADRYINNGKRTGNITRCIKNNSKYKNFIWRYKKDNFSLKIDPYIPHKSYILVFQNNEIIYKFTSIFKTYKKLKIDRRTLKRIIDTDIKINNLNFKYETHP